MAYKRVIWIGWMSFGHFSKINRIGILPLLLRGSLHLQIIWVFGHRDRWIVSR